MKFLRNEKLSVWASVTVEESYDEAEQKDGGPKELCPADVAEKYGLHEADHRASRRAGRGHVVVCLHCHRFSIEDHLWWVSSGTGRSSGNGGVRRAAASTTGGIRTESWSYKMATK